MKKHLHYLRHSWRDLKMLFTDPLFYILTLAGNTVIFLFACVFYVVEGKIQPLSFLDSLWFAFATATTVGYGDVTPQSPLGKILSIFMMLVGASLFACFTLSLPILFCAGIWGVFETRKLGQS